MGALFSTSVSSAVNSMATNEQASCKMVTNTNQTISGTISIDNCHGVKIDGVNNASNVLYCDIGQVSSTVQAATSSADGNVVMGVDFGISESDAASYTSNIVQTTLNSQCGASATVVQNISENIACRDSSNVDIVLANVADPQTMCVLTQLQKSAQTAKSSAKSSLQGWDPLKDLTNGLIAIAAIFGALVLAVLVIKFMMSKADGNSAAAPAPAGAEPSQQPVANPGSAPDAPSNSVPVDVGSNTVPASAPSLVPVAASA
jgi:hypothetical protein